MPARFFEQDVKAGLKDKRRLSGFLDEVIKERRSGTKRASLQYVFCTDEYLLQMNQQFLDHDTLTDIITFDLTEEQSALLGEIYISVERVRENAEKFRVSYIQELHRVIFHGALHLCGLKDKTKVQQAEMRAAEEACLAEYFDNDSQ